MRGSFSSLLATAAALHGPVPTSHTRRVCVARASPAIARLGELLGNNDPMQAPPRPTQRFKFGEVFSVRIGGTTKSAALKIAHAPASRLAQVHVFVDSVHSLSLLCEG